MFYKNGILQEWPQRKTGFSTRLGSISVRTRGGTERLLEGLNLYSTALNRF